MDSPLDASSPFSSLVRSDSHFNLASSLSLFELASELDAESRSLSASLALVSHERREAALVEI